MHRNRQEAPSLDQTTISRDFYPGEIITTGTGLDRPGVSRDNPRVRGERLNDGLSALAVGQGPPLAAFGLSRNRPRAPGEAALVEAVQTWDVTGRLAEISVPVLVVGGPRDRLVPPDLPRATASGIAAARLVLLPGRGHATALFDPRAKPPSQLSSPNRPGELGTARHR